MSGKRFGVSRKPKVLPKRFREGALDRVDRRASGVRYVREGAQQILDDRGGADQASLLMQRAAHRVMHLDALIGVLELRIAQGQQIDSTEYVTLSTTWLRYAQAIGLTRSARRATLTEALAAHKESSHPSPVASKDAAGFSGPMAPAAGGGDQS